MLKLDSPLVTTEWLATHLDHDNLRIIDIRGRVMPASEPPPHYFSHRDKYNESHIPNAQFIDWTTDIVEPNTPSNDILNADDFATLMSKLGIANDSVVIAYDDANGMFASRFWWTMNYYGHENVAILDGGWQKWVNEGRSIQHEVSEVTESTFKISVQSEWLATYETIQDDSNTRLIDVRSPKEFNGEASRGVRFGHIPNAVNLPRKTLISDTGTLPSLDELTNRIQLANIDLDHEAIVYCNSGVSASYVLLALKLVGLKNGRVYDGSWKDWSSRSNLPIE